MSMTMMLLLLLLLMMMMTKMVMMMKNKNKLRMSKKVERELMPPKLLLLLFLLFIQARPLTISFHCATTSFPPFFPRLQGPSCARGRAAEGVCGSVGQAIGGRPSVCRTSPCSHAQTNTCSILISRQRQQQ
jgi:hypothetical protein